MPSPRVPAYRSRADGSSVSLVVKLPADCTKADLRADLKRALGPDWTLTRLFETDLSKPELMRWFRVNGPLAVAGLSQTQAAWEASHRLRGLGDYDIEPQIPKRTYAPNRPAIRSVGGSQEDLPGSASKAWALQKTGVLEAWKLRPKPGGRRRGAGIVVGHPDTGYTRHRELYPAALDLQLDRDVLEGDDDAEDPMLGGSRGHGTSTGSVIASRASLQVTGVAPAATLRPIRAIVDVVVLFGGDVAQAIEYARRSGADAISMSLGGLFLGGVRDAVNAAVEDGCIVMAAAGNVWPWVAEPANYPSCIGVAGVNANDAKWVDSASGPEVDISAPGESVWTATWRDGAQVVERRSGTSYAVAHVAGVAALWLAFHGPGTLRATYGSLTSAAFRRVLAATARKPAGWPASRMGAGIVDARALLSAALPDLADVQTAGPARVRAAAPARDVLWNVTTPTVFRRLERAITARAAEDVPTPSTSSRSEADNELLYRELVYLATEQPAAAQSLGHATARGRLRAPEQELTPGSVASPTLAARLTRR